MHIVLVNPEIAPNTGNIIRLCAITGNDLHLVEPLGFELDDTLLRRGGLDYHERASMTVHGSLESLVDVLGGRWFGFSSHASLGYANVSYEPDDVLVFGSERAGLGHDTLERFSPDRRLTIPMLSGNRSLNLANAVAIVSYEAWRQRGYDGWSAGSAPTAGLTGETPGAAPFDL